MIGLMHDVSCILKMCLVTYYRMLTQVKRHTDPSDVTVNLCLARSDNLEGSQVLFFGRKTLLGMENVGNSGDSCGIEVSKDESNVATEVTKEQFLVGAEAGWATVHWGAHPHLVTALGAGQRTNVVLTYCFTEAGKSTAMKGDCFTDSSRDA